MRLFVAIELSEPVRSVLAKVQADLRAGCDGVRWIPSHQLHLTVKFLGEVPDRDVDKVATAVAQAAKQGGPFELQIAGCGCFPPKGPVRIVWAGGREPSGVLLTCVDALEDKLESLGFARERKRFSPHITIGRVREDRSGGRIRDTVVAQRLDEVRESVTVLTLMSSVLSPKGPTYTPVNKTDLG